MSKRRRSSQIYGGIQLNLCYLCEMKRERFVEQGSLESCTAMRLLNKSQCD